jgi:hypothetical protein
MLVGALAVTIHAPGPSSGTTATSWGAERCPLSTPLATFSAEALATELALEPIALEEPTPDCPLVLVVVAEATWLVVRGILVVGVVVGVVEGLDGFVRRGGEGARFAVVVVVESEVVEGVVVEVVMFELDTLLLGVEGVDVVNVKTSTTKRRGLDHITQWVLLRERSDLIRVLERYRRHRRKIFFHSQPLTTSRASSAGQTSGVPPAARRARCDRGRRALVTIDLQRPARR